MMDMGYIAAGYVATTATVAAYAWSIHSRLRRVDRALPFDTTPPRSSSTPTAVPDVEV